MDEHGQNARDDVNEDGFLTAEALVAAANYLRNARTLEHQPYVITDWLYDQLVKNQMISPKDPGVVPMRKLTKNPGSARLFQTVDQEKPNV